MKVVFVFFAVVCFVTTEDLLDIPNGCPKHWTSYRDKVSFKVFNQNETNFDANDICKSENGGLASVWKFNEKKFIDSFVVNKSKELNLTKFWIGLRALSPNSYEWKWVDGSRNNPLKNKIPLVTIESCLSMQIINGSIYYVPEDCLIQLPFICKRSCLKVYRAGLPWEEFDSSKNNSAYKIFEDRYRTSWFHPLYNPNLGYKVNNTQGIGIIFVDGESRCAFECLLRTECFSFVIECFRKLECFQYICRLFKIIN